MTSPTSRSPLLLVFVMGVAEATSNALGGSVSNGPLRIDYPDIGRTGPIRIFNNGELAGADSWYSFTADDVQLKSGDSACPPAL